MSDVAEIEGGIAVLRDEPVDPAAHHGQRQRGESEVRGDVVGVPVLVRRGRLAVCGRCGRRVELGPPPGLRIVDQRRPFGGRRARVGLAVDRAADRSRRAVRGRHGGRARMLHPLRFPRLAGDHRHRIGRRGRILGGEDRVEDGEPARVAPEERDRVAVDVRHDQPGELRTRFLALGAAGMGIAAPLDLGELVHAGHAVLDVELRRQAFVRMVGRVLERGVLFGADAERPNGDRLPGRGVEIALSEARRVDRGARLLAVGIEPVDAGKRAVFMVERAVLVEDDEDIFDLLPQRRDVARRPFRIAPARVVVADEIGRDVGGRVGLRSRQRPGPGRRHGRKSAGHPEERRRPAKKHRHWTAPRLRIEVRRKPSEDGCHGRAQGTAFEGDEALPLGVKAHAARVSSR